jgi:hypothetical protein
MARSYVLHDDYEYFATRFLGVDYEDYVNLEKGFDETILDLEEVDYEVPVLV